MVEILPHVTIILLNWNGWQDTIECLESILKMDYPNFTIILIDNNSSDDSILQIKNWAFGNSGNSIRTKYPELIFPEAQKPLKLVEFYSDDYAAKSEFQNPLKEALYLIKNTENSGFAVANNLGMEIAANIFKSDYYFLLNNDTVIDKNALSDLVRVMTNDERIGVAQSTIYNYEDREIVNAGGTIQFWGQTKYFKHIGKNEVRRVSSVSGCALFIRARIVSEIGTLSNKFFHGEEDFEYSMRLKKNQQLMVCSGGSRVYHKAGISVIKMMHNYERRTFLFALNRLVNLKDYYPKLIWYVWRIPALTYFFYLFWIKYNIPFIRTVHLTNRIYIYSNKLKDVSKPTIDKIYSEMNFL